jgi:hypothetical protein
MQVQGKRFQAIRGDWMRGKVFRLLLPAAGLAMILFGFLNGEHLLVWTKAVTVCLECIGIG